MSFLDDEFDLVGRRVVNVSVSLVRRWGFFMRLGFFMYIRMRVIKFFNLLFVIYKKRY